MSDAESTAQPIRPEEAELRKALENFTKYDVEILVGKERLGSEASFEPTRYELERIFTLAQQVVGCKLDDIPSPLLVGLRDRLNEVAALFDRMIAYTPRQGHAHATHGELMNGVNRLWAELFNNVHPILAADAHRPREDLQNVLQRWEQQASRNLGVMVETGAEAQLVLDQIRKAAAETGVSQEAIHFKVDADGHWKAAWYWAAGCVVLTTVLVLLSIFLFARPTEMGEGSSGWVAAQRIGGRVLLVSVVSSLLVFCAKNFGTSRHNYVVNRHRANALAAFQSFVSGTADAQTRDAILLQAAKSVFSPQTSGYLRKDGEGQGGVGMVEIVRQVAAKP
jgi:hypothetical protein